MQHEVLWAEDNPLDRELVEAALPEPRPAIRFVDDGVDLMAALGAMGGGLPRLVVLDIKMPRLGGLEALEWMRRQPALREMPVVVFTASCHPRERETCERLGALDYVQKPLGFLAFSQAVERVLRLPAAHVRSSLGVPA